LAPEATGRRRTPTVLQMEAVECGAACLAIVLGYYGRFVLLEELRVACGVTRDGSKASNILKAARVYGLEARGFKLDTERLRQTEMPAVLFWNFNHFVVLEGFGDGLVYLNDPAEGPRAVSDDEFDASYTGVTLTFEPGPAFHRGGRRRSLAAALFSWLSGSKSGLLFAVVAGLALVIPGLVVPTLARLFVDKVLVPKSEGWLRPLLVAMTLTAGVRGGLSWLRQQALLRLETAISVERSSRFLWHVLRLPVEFYTQRYGGEISARVGFNDVIAGFVAGRFAATAIDIVSVVFFGAVMFTYDPLLASVAVAALSLLVLGLSAVNRRRVDGNRRLLQEEGKATGTLMGGLAMIETVKASGTESDLFARWAGYEAKLVTAEQELASVTQTFQVAPPFVIALANAAVLGLGGYRVVTGDLTMGMLVAFQTLLASFLAPVNSLVGLASRLQEIHGHMGRIGDVMRHPLDPETERGEEERATGSGDVGDRLSGAVALSGVTFGYSRLDDPLLASLDLTVPAGARVAVVGPSGCGKSTLARLLTGLYEPWEGKILFDGRPRVEVPRATLTGSIAIVDQEIALFEGSVRDNLVLWDPTIPETTVVEACKDACIHDEIVARPGGYDGPVEEGGANFSGGQRQRLEIARALVCDPRLLVLDEATSALDPVTEEAIVRNLRRRGCTCILIAHRLSTVRDADAIVVLQRGAVVQRGTHEVLMGDPEGLYAALAAEP
jgi:NHLM bacteriocin system ABC transporter peptidase/ATP-binding protein